MSERRELAFSMAQHSDVVQLAEMRTAYLLEDFSELPKERIMEISAQLPGYMERQLNRDLRAYICKDGEKIVATVLMFVTERPASPMVPNGIMGTLMNVYTLPDYRGMGIAKKLVKMAIAEGKELGLSKIELKATPAGAPLYKQLGFKDEAPRYTEMDLKLI